jgi:hypothetical protein
VIAHADVSDDDNSLVNPVTGETKQCYETGVMMSDDQFKRLLCLLDEGDSNLRAAMDLLVEVAELNGLPTANRRYGTKGRELIWIEV